jgi:hypothetical protein
MDLTPTHPGLKYEPIDQPRSAPLSLFVVVDTEEEFDWGQPFNRASTGVTAIRELERFQPLLDRFGIRPLYVIDYPVATKPESYPVLKSLVESGRCAIGAHLHPWMTPPFTEEVTRANSFACNLGAELEEAKMRNLVTAIEDNVGVRPRTYKAGRYGFGETTIGVLQRLNFAIDVSVNPLMNYSSEHGPNFEAFDARPFVFGGAPKLLEVPCTCGFSGLLRSVGLGLHSLAETPAMRKLRAAGILNRTGMLNKIMLSPEMSTYDEMCALTEALAADGLRTFSMTFHSPSVQAGHTPYVRTAADLRAFLMRIEKFCEFFLGKLGGVAATLDEYHAATFQQVAA